MSLPAVLGRSGIVETVKAPLIDEERRLIMESARQLREVIEGCVKEQS